MMLDSGHALPLIALRGSVVLGPARVDREEILWVERARRGDEEAFRWLLARYRERVVRVARAALGGGADAEDAAQEAFIKAFQTLPRLRASGSFYGWVCRIAVRLCLDQKRLKRASEISLSERDFDADDTRSGGVERETVVVVWQLLGRLAPPMRAALILRELDGLEYEEIAEALSIPIGTVRSRLSAARAQFKKLWEDAMREEDAHAARH